MSVEAAAAVDVDLARVNAASLQLAAALAQETTGADAKPTDVERGHAAVQAAEAALQQAQAALQAAEAVQSGRSQSVATTSAAPSASDYVTDPGGIVV